MELSPLFVLWGGSAYYSPKPADTVSLSTIKSYLHLPQSRRGWGMLSVIVVLLIVVLRTCTVNEGASGFRFASVKRGDIEVSVTASGTVQPEEVIDVGAQVAGRILSFGTDSQGHTVDYGSTVEEGTVLASIDDSLYAADVSISDSQVLRAKADVAQLKAKFLQADQDWQRVVKLGANNNALSQSAIDGFRAAYEIAKANLTVGEAALVQAQVTLERAQQNLSYCTIKSPVKGVIIDRRVNVGQTVVSSLNAPSLFLIAKDLTRLQIWAAVNEADIGLIQPGQEVQFGVSTLPGQILTGKVSKIRLNAGMTQNIVSYTVEIVTENPDRKLLPYLTADVRFMITKHTDVLMVPNAALRWTPQPDQISQKNQEKLGISAKSDGIKREQLQGIVWIADGRYVRPLQVNIGASDGINTEISGSDITSGLNVIIGSDRAKSASAATSSPFAPRLTRGAGGR